MVVLLWLSGSRRGARIVAIMVLGALLAACGRSGATPEAVAVEYSRAAYAQDGAQIYRLASVEDQRAREESAVQLGAPTGFALEVARHLASFINATSRETRITGDRAAVRLELRLPDANAPAVAAVVHGWDERRLNALPAAHRAVVLRRRTELHEAGAVPTIRGEETFELVREGGAWRMALGWARGVEVRFRAVARGNLPLELDGPASHDPPGARGAGARERDGEEPIPRRPQGAGRPSYRAGGPGPRARAAPVPPLSARDPQARGLR